MWFIIVLVVIAITMLQISVVAGAIMLTAWLLGSAIAFAKAFLIASIIYTVACFVR